MPTQAIVAVAGTTARNNSQAQITGSNPNVAFFCYDTTAQVLWVYDNIAAGFFSIPVNPAQALAAIASLNYAPVNAAPTAALIAYARYNFAVDGGGAPGLITPAVNTTIPINSILTGVVINAPTAFVGATNTTSVGLSAGGGGAAALLAATAVASWTIDVKLAGIPVPQTASTWIKMSVAGQITFTTAVAALTAGVAEVWVDFVQALNA
jgi:hypothetical protein